MHSIQLKIDDSIFEKVMTMLELLPQDKIKVEEEYHIPAITVEEAKEKVNRAINNIDRDEGVSLDDAFDKALKS